MSLQIENIRDKAATLPDYDHHEQVVRFRDPHSGLDCIIAVHNTSRGPGVGGCRIWHYASETDALTDVLRLSTGMTYKNAMAALPFGGGKAVILAPQASIPNRSKLMAAFGRAVNHLGSAYYTAEDVGTSCSDMTEIRRETPYIFGLSDTSGDPSPFTAYGVFLGIQTAAAYHLQKSDLKGIHVAIQGLGNVGYSLAQQLHQADAHLTVSDIHEDVTQRCHEEFDAQVVAPDDIYDVAAVVYSPCALGSTVTADTMLRLKVKIIAGAANNQLATESLAGELTRRNILYAPDYVINAGGIVNIACEGDSYSAEKANLEVAKIAPRLQALFQRATRENRTTLEVANTMARENFRPHGPQDRATGHGPKAQSLAKV